MPGLCRACGRLSYPIYPHFPFLYVWMNYVANARASRPRLVARGLALGPLIVLVAWAAYRFWDEPNRARLRALASARHAG